MQKIEDKRILQSQNVTSTSVFDDNAQVDTSLSRENIIIDNSQTKITQWINKKWAVNLSKKNILIVIIFISMVFFGWKIIENVKNRENNSADKRVNDSISSDFNISSNNQRQPKEPQLRLPKIVWIYTENPFNAEKMLEQVMGNHLIYMAQKSNWEVKKVNSWTAYGYLSTETQNKITNTMQNALIEQKVGSLYKLGLLLDHGGIIINPTQIILTRTLQWIEQFFIQKHQVSQTDKINALFFKMQNQQAIGDYFIASVKGSLLIRDTFNQICNSITTGNFTFPLVKSQSFINKQVNSVVVKQIIKNTINSYFSYFGFKHYLTKAITLPQKKDCKNMLVYYIKQPKDIFHDICGEPKYLIYLPTDQYRTSLEYKMQKMIETQKFTGMKDSYLSQLMNIPENQKLYEPVELRQVHYCIIDPDSFSNLQAIKDSFQELKKQNYSMWTAVYFQKNISDQHKEYISKIKIEQFNIIIQKDTGNIGRNTELGIIKLCPNKSFILILKTHERLSSYNSLKNLVDTVQPRDVLGAFVALNVSGNIRINPHEYQNYNKYQFNGYEPRIFDLERIKNHLRVFHSDCFKIIPQFQLTTPLGEYYQDRFIFYETFLRMVIRSRQKTDKTQNQHIQKTKWLIKSSRNIFDVPFRINFYNNQPLINTNSFEQINRTQLQLTRFKGNSYSMMESMDHLLQNGQTMEDFAVFNPGQKYQGLLKRKQKNLSQRIPKIIHQIWIGDQPLSQGKKAIIDMNKEKYPDFQFKLWKNQNITRQNFPLSYDLIQNLFKINTFSRFSKMATVADVMRHEIMYNEGGFYMDTSMYLFNNVFYDWLTYRVVIPTMQPLKHRWIQSMCIFANQPKYPGLLRIISHNNTNRYNIYHRDAQQIAGPYDFRQYIQGKDEYDPDVLIMAFEQFFPMDYTIKFSYFQSKCAKRQDYLEPVDQVVIKSNKRYIIKNCGKYYPRIYGKEVSQIGGSTWQYPR